MQTPYDFDRRRERCLEHNALQSHSPINGETPGASTAHGQKPVSARCLSARATYASLSSRVRTPPRHSHNGRIRILLREHGKIAFPPGTENEAGGSDQGRPPPAVDKTKTVITYESHWTHRRTRNTEINQPAGRQNSWFPAAGSAYSIVESCPVATCSLRSAPTKPAICLLSGGHVMYGASRQPERPPGAVPAWRPGAGAGAVHRRFFDPNFWRIVIFDQRGAGRSRPLGGLDNNSTPDLVSDIEILRRHLAIERFLLFGGSWGSTLALAYAQAHPQRVAGAVLRGVFLGRPQEVEWFLHGMRPVFPEAHAAFTGFLPEAERDGPIGLIFAPPDQPRSLGPSAGCPSLVRL